MKSVTLIKNRIILCFLLLVVSVLAYAQESPPCPNCGTGGTGPGEPASPIDGYIFTLGIIAVAFIFYFTKKYKKQII